MGGTTAHLPGSFLSPTLCPLTHKDMGMDLSALTESERDAILAVLERDDHLRQQDKKRLSRLKTELSWLRRRGAVRTDEEDGAGWRACGRCRAELGLIINRGAPCRACRQRVCKQCREFGVNGRDWVCTVCHKHIEIQLASGEWMNEFVRRPSRRREHKVYVPPADVVKRSLIKRSWTISRSDLREDGTRKKRSFPCPAGVERTSPELRVLGCRPPDGLHKPPRGHRPPTDENEPPWDALHYPSQGAPPRRYSMSSVDGVAPSSRHVKGPAPLPPRGGPFQESQGYHSPHLLQQQPSLDSPPLAQRRRLLPGLPQQPTRLPPTKPERPSTLPRKLRQPKDTSDQTHLSPPLAHDADRFHSMPRTRARSPGGPGRGHSDPSRRSRSPVVPLGGYISSGPVTSTPIMHDPNIGPHRLSTSQQPTPAPRDLSRPPASGRPPEQNIPTSQMRHHPQIPPQGVTRIIEIEVERDDGPDTSSRGPASRTNSGMSTSSRGTPNSSDQDGEANVFSKLSSSRPHQAVSPSTSHQHQAAPSPTYRPHQAVSPPISHPHQAASPSASHLRPTTSPPLQHPRQAASPPASHPRQAMSPAAQHPRQPSSSPIIPPRQPSMSPVTHPRLATTTTRLISGFATTGRPRKPSHNPAGVRRSRSFQVGSPRVDDEYPAPLWREALSGQVARYVRELERGIQMTVENMMPKKHQLLAGDHPRPPSSPSKDSSRSLGRRPRDKQPTSSPSDTSDAGTPKLELDDRSSGRHSDNSSSQRHSDAASDIVLDAEKIQPEGDDYKLVFISSDSSKDSELNSSIDSDNSGSPSRRVSSASAVNDSDNAGFIEESDWDYFESESQAGRRRKMNGTAPRVSAPARVDASVMTDGEYLSGGASEGEDSEVELSRVPDASLDVSLEVPSPVATPAPHHDGSGSTEGHTAVGGLSDPNTTTTPAPVQPLLKPLTAMDTKELHAMLRQTEAVQAEAQALQAALMGAFTPSDPALGAVSAGRWLRRGDSTRSSAERSVGEVSCQDQVRPLGSPHDSPALREYRKRVLTEIQNYYGVNPGTSVRGHGRPDWFSYLRQHHQRPASPALLSRVSHPGKDKPARQGVAREAGTSVKAAATVAGGARKSSRDMCIQTDPDASVLTSNCDEEQFTPEARDSSAPPRLLRGPLDSHTLQATAAARLTALVQGIPRRTQGCTVSRASGGGDGGAGVGGGGDGGGGGVGGGREREGGEELTSRLPHPPSFHLHLTLSRETSVAHPSDSETDERLVEYSSCVSSELGGESVSDFEYQEDPSQRGRRLEAGLKEESQREDGRAGVVGTEGSKEHGGRGGGKEAPRSPRIAAANTTHAPTNHSTRLPPPQPAPRRTMSALRPQQDALPQAQHLQETDSDLDAPERVIQAVVTSQPASPRLPSAAAPLVLVASEDQDSPSSSTSEAEDTDEDVHASGSYNVAAPDEADGEGEAKHAAESETISDLFQAAQPDSDSSSSSSGSDTDEDKHVSKEYSLARSSSAESDLNKSDVDAPKENPVPMAVSSEGVDIVEAVNPAIRTDVVDDAGVAGAAQEVHHQHLVEAINLQVCDLTSDDIVIRLDDPQTERTSCQDLREGRREGGGNESENSRKETREGLDSSGQDVEISDVQHSNVGEGVGEAEGRSDEPSSASTEEDGAPVEEVKCSERDDVKEKVSVDSTSDGVSENSVIQVEIDTGVGENSVNSSVVKDDGDVRGVSGEDTGVIGSAVSVGDSDVLSAKVTVTSDPRVLPHEGDGDTVSQGTPAAQIEGNSEIVVTSEAVATSEVSSASETVAAVQDAPVLDIVAALEVATTSEAVGITEPKTATTSEVTTTPEVTTTGETASPQEASVTQETVSSPEVVTCTPEKDSIAGEEAAAAAVATPCPETEVTCEVTAAPVASHDHQKPEVNTCPQEEQNPPEGDVAVSSALVEAETVPGVDTQPQESPPGEPATTSCNTCTAGEGVVTEVVGGASGPRPGLPGHVSESEEPSPRESEGPRCAAESKAAAGGGSQGEIPKLSGTTVHAGSEQVEHSSAAPSCGHTPVTHNAPAGPHVSTAALHSHSLVTSVAADTAPHGDLHTPPHDHILECDNTKVKEVNGEGESSESGHSSAGESEVEGDDPGNVVKISVTEGRHRQHEDDGISIPVSGLGGDGLGQEVTRFAVRRVRSPEIVSRRTPPVPSRRTKRSSSSDGVSSSSDIERSDADASDSADTVVEGGKLHAELRRFALQQRRHDHDDKGRDSDGPSSADSVLHGGDSESQCSDNSEEGNLVSIVSVGDEDDHSTRLSSQGRIYIRSDSTDSDVQIKPTCIVVTGSSGAESGEDADADADGINTERNIKNEGNDVTILEVTSDARRGHVMSVHVTSPDSSRSASPARRSNVSELQSMILTTRERQQQFRRSPSEMKESSSSLANYFTLTLGTDSPHAPRRLNKTPEIRRRKIDRSEALESPATTSPSSPAQTPDHSEGDLLAYEEHHGIDIEEEYSNTHEYDSWEDGERPVSFPDEVVFDEDVSFDEVNQEFIDGDFEGDDSFVEQEVDGRFDSIEDGESVNSESNYSESSGDEICDREDELRGYCNRAIDFTLHTIIEESCEESDYERKPKEEDGGKADPSELEKYFYFGLGNGPAEPKRYANEESEYSDTFSETSSSIFSEGVDIDPKYDEDVDPAELASSRLEKYFLTGFLGFERQPSIRSMGEDSELHTDESGSVGSDSEGSPSPEQPRKKLLRRPRGFRPGVVNRSLVTGDRWDGAPSDGSHHSEGDDVDRTLVSGEDEGSTESEETAFDKGDGQFDTIKRRKKKKTSGDYSDKKSDSDKSELRALEQHEIEHREEICELKNSEALKSLVHEGEKVTKRVTIDCDRDSKERSEEKMEKEGDLSDRKYQSRDSGFIGSSDDLLKDKPEDTSKEQKARLSSESSVEEGESSSKRDDHSQDVSSKNEENKSDSFDNDSNNNKSENEERSSGDGKVSRSSTGSSVDLPPFCPDKARNKICRKDSFNNWSSDEETNLMMNKMRAFFKTMISNSREASKGQRVKPPQLVAFEAKLTNLMKTVPGINDEQVKEIVEYLSSEDTWSDSYDSSDYTSSDLEGAYAFLDQADPERRSDLQEQISASCQQIIQKFDQSREPSDTDSAHSFYGGRACSESSEDASPSSKDTVFMYQRLMSSISRLKPESDRGSIGSGSQGASPPLLAKVMHHIGNRLVALMHEVSGGSENGDDDSLSGGQPVTSSPKVPLFIPRKHISVDSISVDSSVEKSSLTSTSFESEDSPTDTEQSPESEHGTPKARKRQGPLSVISERSSAEDFTSLESQRTVFASHDSPRHQARPDAARPHQNTASERSLEERGVTNIQYFVTEGSNNEVEVWQSVTIDEDKFDAREHHGVPRARRSARRQEARKAKSHMSLEKIHQEEVKTTGERSESLGDLLDRVRSSEFSSSYEQLDSDSTLKAADSLDRHIGSSSSNFRLNASSRGSLTTSSRGSLAASSRGSLNAGSRGSLQGSSGPEEEDEKKPKKLNFFRYARRSSMPDTSKDRMSPEVRSTTLPRSNPTQVASTASLPRSQFALLSKTSPSVTTSTHTPFSSPPSTLDRGMGSSTTGPRSARYHAPGYRPPPSTTTPKRTFSSPGLASSIRKDSASVWPPQDESTAGCAEEGFIGQKSGSPSPLVGSVGRISGRDSIASLASSTDTSCLTHPDDDIERLLQLSEKKTSSLTPLGSRSESMASVCSAGAEGRYGTVTIKGEIELGLQYNYKEGQLECRVVQCRDLAAVDNKRNRSDPYVKVYLLPDKSKSGKRKTKVKKHTLNPVFEEVLRFSTTMSELDSRTLWVSVWHSDMFGRNDFLGEVIISLTDTVFDDVTPRWYPLQDRMEPMEDLSYSPRGDLILALKFVPPDAVSTKKSRRSRGALHVLVKEAKSLAAARPHGTADPVCKGLLLPEKGKASKQKTSVCRKTLNPTWNHTLVFEDTSLQELTERALELSVWDHDRLGPSQFLGGCRLNLGKGKHGGRPVEWMEAAGMEVKLWEQMLERPNLWVEGSIMLRPAMDKPIYSSSMTE